MSNLQFTHVLMATCTKWHT